MSETVIRELVTSLRLWHAQLNVFSPFTRSGFIPFGGRSTAIKLKSGGVWVLASTPLEPETKAKIDDLGPVKYIISPDAVHHLYLGEFKKAYPEAKLIGPAEAIERHDDKNLVFDGVWGRDPPDTFFFSGFKNKDVAFLHVESKTLMEADLLFNLPAKEQYSKSPSSSYISSLWAIPGIPFVRGLSPSSWFHPRVVWSMGEDKE
ncbi:hypothetical protein H0H92_003623 [Tricholoma furcatifolium]|nr:hypothetical protein H0H92_003623 [Tricholoma furcatifolium]